MAEINEWVDGGNMYDWSKQAHAPYREAVGGLERYGVVKNKNNRVVYIASNYKDAKDRAHFLNRVHEIKKG